MKWGWIQEKNYNYIKKYKVHPRDTFDDAISKLIEEIEEHKKHKQDHNLEYHLNKIRLLFKNGR